MMWVWALPSVSELRIWSRLTGRRRPRNHQKLQAKPKKKKKKKKKKTRSISQGERTQKKKLDFDLGLLAFRNVRKKKICFLSHLVCGILLWQFEQTNADFKRKLLEWKCRLPFITKYYGLWCCLDSGVWYIYLGGWAVVTWGPGVNWKNGGDSGPSL